MARPMTRYTQRMLDAASCRHRYEIEFVRNHRRSKSEKWFPPKLKDLLAEMLYARDYGIAGGFDYEEVDALVIRMRTKWWDAITRNRFTNQETNNEAISIMSMADSIVSHYSKTHRSDFAVKNIKRKKKPIVRTITEHRLSTFEKKKLGGASKYTFAASIDRDVFNEFKSLILV